MPQEVWLTRLKSYFRFDGIGFSSWGSSVIDGMVSRGYSATSARVIDKTACLLAVRPFITVEPIEHVGEYL